MFTVRKRGSGNNDILAIPLNAGSLEYLISDYLDLNPGATLLVSRSTDADRDELDSACEREEEG